MKLNGIVHYINKNIVVNNRHRVLYLYCQWKLVSSDVYWPQKRAANYWTSLLLQTVILLQGKKKVDVLFHCMSFCLQFCNKLEKKKPNMPYQILNEHGFYFWKQIVL